MRYLKLFFCLVFIGLLTGPLVSMAQPAQPVVPPVNAVANPENDSTTTIIILPGVRKLEFRKINDSTQLQILAGNVKLKQGNTLFYSDSCVINNNTHVFEAWGHVHIIDSDTADVYSNHLLYQINKKMAYLDGAVKLTDGHGTLTTPDLEYDLETKIGIYKHGGKVVTNNTVLTSKEGYYYTDLKDVYFKNNVDLKDPAYYIKTDSLLYNTELQSARFIAETYIRDSSGRIIETKDGVYNMQTGMATFGRRPRVHDKNMFATGNEMMSDDSAGIVQIRGNAIVIDSANHTTIIAGEIFVNNKKNSFLAFKKPLMIVKQDNDSIYITADTLFSARLTDLVIKKDSLNPVSAKEGIPDIERPVMAMNRREPGNINLLENPKEKNLTRNDSIPDPNLPTLAQYNKDSLIADSINTNLAIEIKEKDSSLIKIEPVLSRITKDSLKTDNGKINPANMINEKDSSRSIVKRDPAAKKIDSLKTDTLSANKTTTLNEKDSTNRYFEAFRNVRIFSDSMQAVCDSMFYSFQDSVFRLFDDPVVWAKESQISGDTIFLFTKNNKADRMKITNNSLMVNKMETEIYNQVKSSRMEGYFTEGTLDSVHASGLAECIYFIQDEDSAYTGVNQSKSDILDAYFLNKGLQKVVFRSSVTGTIWPIQQKDPKEMRLTKFRWLEARRPRSKFDLF